MTPLRIVGWACMFCFAQEAKIRSARMDNAASDALQASREPGGIEINLGCTDLPQVNYEVTFGDPEKSLHSIPTPRQTTQSWSKPRTAYCVVPGTKRLSPRIASIAVPEKVIEAETLNYASDLLLQDPSSVLRSSNFNLKTYFSDASGFTSILAGKNRKINRYTLKRLSGCSVMTSEATHLLLLYGRLKTTTVNR